MTREEAQRLIEKYTAGTASADEAKLIERAYARIADNGADPISEHAVQEAQAAVWKRLTHGGSRSRRLTRWLPYAAAAVLALAIGFWVVGDWRSVMGDRWSVVSDGSDIAPGGNRATLTLADGRTITLDEAQTGIVVGDGVTYLDGSAVLGETVRPGEREEPHTLTPSQSHKLTTPKGGTYQITLPDGSKVWLNSASTLKYPSRFDGDERVVELEGEAYFDIKPMLLHASGERMGNHAGLSAFAPLRENKTPFLVKTNTQTVEVLGTQFNISAYADDPETKTTLVEGKVNVSVKASTLDKSPTTDHQSQLLTPGTQSTIRNARIEIQHVDVEQYTSWKDGFFYLEGTVPTILKEISRWYDIEVVYENEINDPVNLAITFPRDRALSDVLHVLQRAVPAMRYRIEEIKRSNEQNVEPRAERRLTIFR